MRVAALLVTAIVVVGCAAPPPPLAPPPPPPLNVQAPPPPPPPLQVTAPPPGPRAGPSMRYRAAPKKVRCHIKKRKVPVTNAAGKTYYRTAKYKVC